jgi:proliferating cell nuclear antigen
MEGFEHYRAD